MVLPKYQHQKRKQYAAGVAALALFLLILGLGQFAFVMVLLLLPVAIFFVWVFKQQQHHGVTDQEIKQLFYCFLAGVFPTSLLALLAQCVLVPLWAMLCFYDQKDTLDKQLRSFFAADRDDDDGAAVGSSSSSSSGSFGTAASTPHHASRLADFLQQLDVEKSFGYYVFMFAMAFAVAALVEEYLKLWVVQGTCCCSTTPKPTKPAGSSSSPVRSSRGQVPPAKSTKGWLCNPSRLLFQHQKHSSHSFVVFMAVVAGALGFSFIESIGYTFGVREFGDRVLTAVLRGVVSAPLHCICGGITGVRLAERVQARRAGNSAEKLLASEDLAKWRTKVTLLWPAMLVHGAFDAQILLVASLVTDEMATAHPIAYGIVLSSIGSLLVLGVGFWYLRRSLHGMEQHMNAGRYIQVAVDLESGKRVVGFSDDDSDDDDDDNGVFGDQEREFSHGARKTRAVFTI